MSLSFEWKIAPYQSVVFVAACLPSSVLALGASIAFTAIQTVTSLNPTSTAVACSIILEGQSNFSASLAGNVVDEATSSANHTEPSYPIWPGTGSLHTEEFWLSDSQEEIFEQDHVPHYQDHLFNHSGAEWRFDLNEDEQIWGVPDWEYQSFTDTATFPKPFFENTQENPSGSWTDLTRLSNEIPTKTSGAFGLSVLTESPDEYSSHEEYNSTTSDSDGGYRPSPPASGSQKRKRSFDPDSQILASILTDRDILGVSKDYGQLLEKHGQQEFKARLWESDPPPKPSNTSHWWWSQAPNLGLAAATIFSLGISKDADDRKPKRQKPSTNPPKDESSWDNDITLQLETSLISQERLEAEVKGIYAGLAMVEAKCIEVGNGQAKLASADSEAQLKLNNEQWQAFVALHPMLLHEHHDFFIASQHPSISPALRRLASRYAMPARMWRHGIHSFLELSKHRLPGSLDHMQAFIYLAYSMMALLHETIPAFEDTWVECLSDLERYRIRIEDDDTHNREVWRRVAHQWYSNSSHGSTTGRLYHHLAILGRPHTNSRLCLVTLPSQIHERLASHLSYKEFDSLTRTSKRLRDIYKPLWRNTLSFAMPGHDTGNGRIPSNTHVQSPNCWGEHQQWTTQATLGLPMDPSEMIIPFPLKNITENSDWTEYVPSLMMEPFDDTFDNELLLLGQLYFEDEDNISRGAASRPTTELGKGYSVTQKQSSEEGSGLTGSLLHDLHHYASLSLVVTSAVTSCEHGAQNEAPEELLEYGFAARSCQNSNSPVIDGTDLSRGSAGQVPLLAPGLEDEGSLKTSKFLSQNSRLRKPRSMALEGSGPGNYICVQCRQSFPRMCDLKKHAKYHTKSLPYPVFKCSESFSRQQDLDRHLRGPHGVGKEHIICPYPNCGKSCTRKDNLRRHMKTAHGSQENSDNDGGSL